MEITTSKKNNDIIEVVESTDFKYKIGDRFFVRNRMYDRSNNKLLYTVIMKMNGSGPEGQIIKFYDDGSVKFEVVGKYDLNTTVINSYENICTK